MVAAERRPHSPLGGSGAYRWMVCPGSVQLSEGHDDPESEYAAEGSAAHSLGEHCLRERMEPWEFVGREVYAREGGGYVTVDAEMARAVTDYLTELRNFHGKSAGDTWVEHAFHCPGLHELYYGAADYVHYCRGVLDVWDYKHGAGIVVEAENNPQLLYYGAGVLEDLDLWGSARTVRLHVFQPRGWHYAGPHRMWEVSINELMEWLDDKCLPAMRRAMVSRDTVSGEHCRFCAARFSQCPALLADVARWAELVLEADEMGADKLTPEQVGELLRLHEIAKIAVKAAGQRGYQLLSNGHEVPGCKLVKSRTNREFKNGAEKAAVRKFGKRQAFTEPALKTPAQIDKMPGGKEFTARWAFKPEGALTVAVEGDPRRAVRRDVASLFKPVTDK